MAKSRVVPAQSLRRLDTFTVLELLQREHATARRKLERSGVPRSAAVAMVGHETESLGYRARRSKAAICAPLRTRRNPSTSAGWLSVRPSTAFVRPISW